MRASHILIGTRDTVTGDELSAEQKAAKRKQIDDLQAAVAARISPNWPKEFSEDPGSQRHRRRIHLRARADGSPEFEAAAFSLNTNPVSDVITTYGFHIIKLARSSPPR